MQSNRNLVAQSSVRSFAFCFPSEPDALRSRLMAVMTRQAVAPKRVAADLVGPGFWRGWNVHCAHGYRGSRRLCMASDLVQIRQRSA